MERDLREQLAIAQMKVEVEYDRAVVVITDNYQAQMLVMKDAVWEMAWRRCLSKLGVEDSSPYCIDRELPSNTANAHPASQPQPDPMLQPELPLEQTQIDEAITDLIIPEDNVAEGNNSDPSLAANASMLSEEA